MVVVVVTTTGALVVVVVVVVVEGVNTKLESPTNKASLLLLSMTLKRLFLRYSGSRGGPN